jgi:hypothetical protein
MRMCLVAREIELRDGKTLVRKVDLNGKAQECTPLYYHLLQCDNCREIQERKE